MGFLSWFNSSKPQRLPSADETAKVLVHSLMHWCSPEKMADMRATLHIPADARNFDAELFYLDVFLTMVGIEISYRDKEAFRLDLGRSFFFHLNDAMDDDSLAFHPSPDTMQHRYAQYLSKLRERGIEHIGEFLPYTFLIFNGVCRSDSRDDMSSLTMPILAMRHWVSAMLDELLSFNQKWRKHYGF